MSQRKRTFWADEDRGLVAGWSDIAAEWEDPTFDAVAGELELADLPRIPLDLLTFRQRLVVERLWGLNGHDAYTERELAEAIGISQAAIQNLEKRALERMRRGLEEGVVT